MLKLKKKTYGTPNFSIVLPGPCNASCGFCFWKRNTNEHPLFVQKLALHLGTLESTITQISLTGGEPTLSPVLNEVLNVLRWQSGKRKVVLTSNGCNMKEKLPSFSGVVNHINISRHSVGDEDNFEVFGTRSVPTQVGLSIICDMANMRGIDVTLNRVVQYDYADVEDFKEYVRFAKDVGASAIAFRKNHATNSLEKTEVEKALGHAGITRNCSVCMTSHYVYRGMPVRFMQSLAEPSETIDGIYEFVCHPDGRLTEDWQGKKEVEFVDVVPRAPVEYTPRCSGGGCGGRGCS